MKLRKTVYFLLAALGINALMRRLRTGAVILCYHNVVRHGSPPGDPEPHMCLADFEAQMEWLGSRFDVVPLERLAERLRSGQSIRGLAALTFDDGYVGVLRNALPVLASAGLPCTIFVTGGPPSAPSPFWWDFPAIGHRAALPAVRQRLLSDLQGDARRISAEFGSGAVEVEDEYLPADWSALRAATSPLVEFGAHSMSHRSMVTLDDGELDMEISGSADVIAVSLGRRPTLFAYPYGLWNERSAQAAAAAKFSMAFTLGDLDARFTDHPMAVPRLNIPASIKLPAFETWVSGLAHGRALWHRHAR